MSHHPKVPMGNLVVDARGLAEFIVDLEQGKMQGLRTEQKGYAEVVTELVSNQREFGEQAGITQTDIERLVELNRRVAMVDQYLPAVRKMLELLTETRAVCDDERQRLVSAFGQSVDARAKASRNPTLLAKYERTRDYRSAIANKGAKTRKKNAALLAEAEAVTGEPES